MAKKELTPEERMEQNVRRQMQRHGAKIRERIKADAELLEDQRRTEARNLILAMEMQAERKTEVDSFHKALYLCNAIKSVTTVVARSFNIDQSINYRYEKVYSNDVPWLKAYTDLKSVELRIAPNTMDTSDDKNVRRTVAVIKGATYHEVAHCLWTKHMIADYFKDEVNRKKYHRAWNLLEDGRIESLLIKKSPIIKKYLLPMMWDIVVNLTKDDVSAEFKLGSAVPFLLVRTYIPRGMQRQALHSANTFVAKHRPSDAQHIAGLISDMLATSKEYNACTTITDQIPFITMFHELLTRWNSIFGEVYTSDGVGREDGMGLPTGMPNVVESVDVPSEWDETLVSETAPKSDKPKTKSESDTPINPNSNADDDGDSGEDDQENTPDTPQDKSEGDSQDKSDDGDDHIQSDQSVASDYGDESEGKYNELDKSVEEAVSDYELTAVMREWNNTIATGLPSYDGALVADQRVSKEGEMVRTGMLNALDTVVMTASPSWKYRMENGAVLDVDAFTNREMGDDAYWMAKDDSGERGHDLAISVLLDCSGSMSHNLASLGACAYGIHGASQALGIPCTTSIFGTNGYLLWDEDSIPMPAILPDLGGTHVRQCLESVPNQRAGKSRQIVFILTDGDWEYDIPTLQPFMDEGVHTVLIGLNLALAKLQAKNPSRAITIRSVLDLPKQVELVIGDFFR